MTLYALLSILVCIVILVRTQGTDDSFIWFLRPMIYLYLFTVILQVIIGYPHPGMLYEPGTVTT